ncbi:MULTISPECIES: L,D-transpeptidase family protein [unclassified Roseivivax]|uniref:L,D-transpeptidase family protein n=1 Tax=Roseivivax sp. GX 12232 TaxID=2900547 RepID=UPI001E5FB2A6|nr:L,D-transpeptidase family protein [Roseivivax sp. GX 12232]MCE0504192.1 L,D-transpeptidase family protein [Roseivivax sp. GX 12232]
MMFPRAFRFRMAAAAALVSLGLTALPAPALAQVTAFKQAVAETVAEHDGLNDFYRARLFEPVWTGGEALHRDRRAMLIDAMRRVEAHGIPAARHDADRLYRMLRAADTPRARGEAEVEMSLAYLRLARDLQTGILDPREVVRAIKRDPEARSPEDLLARLGSEEPRALFRSLAPQSPEYVRLMATRVALEDQRARGGWGPAVRASKLSPGDSGEAVVALRNRLVSMGYLGHTSTAFYDRAMERAVRDFQEDHGQEIDGVAGDATLSALNVGIDERLKSVIVAMERERWMNRPGGLGERHIKVNLTEFKARIYDDDKVTFETRAVVGSRESDRQTPEFSDVMEFMEINPSWYVPRSIVVNEYLPMLRRNPYSVSHLEITDSRGRQVNRGRGFSQYSASSFPFSMRQPPGPKNALGSVKFMFPNRYNIYLHDTPAQSLFSRTVRTFSHGCVRLNDPHDFAYALLAKQEADPVGFFQNHLGKRSTVRVNLETKVPVHLIYRTAFTTAKGRTQYRDDIYGRDAQIWRALEASGVSLGGLQS